MHAARGLRVVPCKTRERWPNDLSLPFVEDLYSEYLRNPESVPLDWRRYFEGLVRRQGRPGRDPHRSELRPDQHLQPRGQGLPPLPQPAAGRGTGVAFSTASTSSSATTGCAATSSPASTRWASPAPSRRNWSPNSTASARTILDRPFAGKRFNGQTLVTVRQIIERLRNTYCRSIGVQFMHIDDLAVRDWLQERMESTENRARAVAATSSSAS